MTDLFEEMLDDFERERLQNHSASCLPDETLQALADQSLPGPAIEQARRHLEECLSCLHAYATFRSLLEASSAAKLATKMTVWRAEEKADRRKSIWDNVRHLLAFRIPAGWGVAATVAGALLTWTLVGQIPGTRGTFRSDGLDQTGRPYRLTELSHKEGNRPVTISGTVENLRPASAEAFDAYVVTLRTSMGEEYLIFTWHRPAVREGQTVEVDGVFMNITESGGPVTFQGVASQLRPIGSE